MQIRTFLSTEARARLINWLNLVLQPGLVAERYAEVLESAHREDPKPDEQVVFEVPGDYTRSGERAVLSFVSEADFLSAQA